MKKKLIKVTQRDIDLGKRKSKKCCPVARAMCRAFKKKLGYFNVLNYSAANKKKINIKFPSSTIGFIQDFDLGHFVYPFTFHAEY